MVLERLSRFVLRYRLAVALVWLAVLAAGVATAGKVSGRLSQEFSVPSAPSYTVNQQILATYGTGGDGYPEVAVITLPPGATVDSPGIRQALHRAFALVTANLRLRVVSYADPNPNPNPTSGSGARPDKGDRRLVSTDGRTTIGLIFTPHHGELQATNLAPQITTTLQRALPAGTTVQVTGLDALVAGGSSGQGPGVLTETLLGGLGALAVLAFVFGSLLALAPLLIAAVAILATFLVILGLTELTQVSFIVQFLVALIGLGVSIDYSLLLVTRWREELAHGQAGDEAVHAAMATAGRAIIFSGLTVAVGLLALVLVPVPFLRSMGYGGMLIPLVGVLVTLTLLPVLLASVGRRLDWPRLRREAHASRGWTAWARGVIHHRWLAAVGALAVLAALGMAALGIQIGEPAATALAGSTSNSSPAIDGLRTLQRAGIPTGVLTPIELLVSTSPGTGVDPARVAARLAGVPGIHTALAPTGAAWRRGATALVEVLPVAETSTAAGRATLTRVRDTINAASEPRQHSVTVAVGGAGASLVDETHAFYSRFPLMLAAIALITLVLLARAFRSLLLPLKAVLLNLASVGATYGVLVLVWQHGHGSKLIWNIPATGAITNWVPLITFAFLYGLSMDYEVFILVRMREAHDRGDSTTTAITEGIGRTGRLVTSAALILFLAFASLGAGPETDIKVAATALGAGILLDATIVRALLVPALVSLFGRWNWWLPAWAARLLRVPPSPARDRSEPEPNFARAPTPSHRAQPTQPR